MRDNLTHAKRYLILAFKHEQHEAQKSQDFSSVLTSAQIKLLYLETAKEEGEASANHEAY